jgi:hypothetical protein
MAVFPDLGPINYFPVSDARSLRAVGWLGRGQEFRLGEVSREFFTQLCRLLVSPWEPFATRGFHACSLCQFTDGPRQLQFAGMTVTMGCSNLFVPSDGCIYVAPSLIAHYVDAHHYSPPEEFVRHVLRCPETRTMEYKRLLLANGGRALLA